MRIDIVNAYREGEAPPLEPVKVGPRGLVRANGSACQCTPPGVLWCWWRDVQERDRWFCDHGGCFQRTSYATWQAVTPDRSKAE